MTQLYWILLDSFHGILHSAKILPGPTQGPSSNSLIFLPHKKNNISPAHQKFINYSSISHNPDLGSSIPKNHDQANYSLSTENISQKKKIVGVAKYSIPYVNK